MRRARRVALGLMLGALLITALGVTGQSDVEAARQDQARYCAMVSAGHWPAYDPDIDCVGAP